MLKNLWLHSLRFYLKLGLFFYFRTFKVFGKGNIPQDKAVLVLGNHQSALIDPLLLAVVFPQFAYYLTRAGVFQNKWVRTLLKSVNMLPVYRKRDGWNNLTNNTPVFENCRTLLCRKETVVIFPEGSHNLKRTVRPLSKGFTRIVLDTLNACPDTDMYLLPVGFNYEDAANFPDSASVYFGNPLRAAELVSDDIHESRRVLKSTVYQELTKLTTHLPTEHYDEQLRRLEAIPVNFLYPKAVNACRDNLEICEQGRPRRGFLKKLLKPVVYLNLMLPIAFWRFLVKPRVRELEFMATFRFAVALILIPFWLLVLALIFFSFFGSVVTGIYVLLSVVLMLLYVKA